MKSLGTVLSLLISLHSLAVASDHAPGGMQLLDGYVAKQDWAVDAQAWTIQGKNGLVIHFEAGPSEGRAVDPKDIDKYEWYREQSVGGHKVLLALTKRGVKDDADLDSERNLPPGNVLMVTFPLGSHRSHAANFVAKIASQKEMLDVLLMVLTYDPSK